MAQKIPVYGEFDCRTSENILADAEQIRYDATKNVKEKIEELETGGSGGGVDEDTFNNTTGRILQQLCAIADTKLAAHTMHQIHLNAEYGDILYLNKIDNTEDDYLSIGLASDSGSFTLPTSTDYYYTDSIVNFRIPCIIRSFKAGNYYGWEISQVSISSIGRTINTTSIIANNANIKTLDVAIGAYVNTSNNTWSTNIGDTARYKLVRPSSALIMPKFSIRNISSSNAQVIDQYTVCEKYDSIYYRATHYFKLEATSTSGKIHLEGDLVLTNGSISVRTYVQELFGFATFAGIDTSSTSDNDYALSVTATEYESPLNWNNNTNIARVVIDSNSTFDASGDKVSIMVVVLFKSSDL